MSKRLNRTIAGVMSLMFVGQVMIFGDGSAQGILHANTIASAAEAIEEAKNAEDLAAEFDAATEGLGEVEYFGSPDANVMLMSEANEVDSDGSSIASIEDPADYLTVTGKVTKGVVEGLEDKSNTPIYIRIFDGNWSEIAYTEVSGNGGSYTVTADYTDVYHVKFECDGYLPFYLKDFGTGKYQVGSGESWDTVTLIPGDTTYNYYNANQWSDDVIDGNDSAYVQSCLGATRGDSDFNPTMDADGDNIISQSDLDIFCSYYTELKNSGDQIILSEFTMSLDINKDGVINDTDYNILSDVVETGTNSGGYELPELAGGNSTFDADDLAVFKVYLDDARVYGMEVFIYNHEMTNDIYVDANDHSDGVDKINRVAQKRGRSDNYYEYMDKDDNGTIENSDVSWFSSAYTISGDLDWDHAFKRNLKVLESGKFNYSLNLHDTNLDLNEQTLYVNDCMSFTTDMPQFWDGTNGATLDIHGGYLEITNNLVFRTASPDGWSGNAGQLLDMNGGTVIIGNCFDFGQANCYDIIEMTNDSDHLEVWGNWTYITLTDMEGKWTAGEIWFYGPHWNVNEASGDKAIYSSGTQTIYFGNPDGQQTILWDNPNTYINDADGSLNTLRCFNFNYTDAETGECLGLVFSDGYSSDKYYFRPYLPQYITNLEDPVPYEEWKYMEDSNGNTIPDVVEQQIEEDPLNVDNTWLEERYGVSVTEFIDEENKNSDTNKETLVDNLCYLYNNYIEPVADAAASYVGKSLNQIVAGNFTDDVTLLGTAGQIALGIFDLDLVCDLRDTAYDIGEWGEIIIGEEEFSWSFAGQSFIDIIGILPVIGAIKYSDEVGVLIKNPPDIYENSVYKSVAECFTDGKAIKSEDEITEAVTNNLKKTQKQIEELLDDSGKFIDESLESDYQKYVLRKQNSGKVPRDRIDWKEASDYWKYDSPIARGNEFNKIAKEIYPYNEVSLANGKRLDSYIPGEKIISRKATDLSIIEFDTFDKYLSEMTQKYAPGTIIRSNTCKPIDGQALSGQMCLEIPAVNKDFDQIDEYMTYAKENYDIEIIFLEENKVWDFSNLIN